MAYAAGRVLRSCAAKPTFDVQLVGVGEQLVLLCKIKELGVLPTR